MSGDDARIILEEFENKIAIVIEMLHDQNKKMATKEDIQELRDEINVTQKALRATNEDVRLHTKEIAFIKHQIA